MRTRLVCGAALWLARPAYVVVELVVAAATTGDYSLVTDTVSDLGAAGCTPAYCSPLRDLMNGAFVLTGLALAVGAMLLATRVGAAATALLVVSGLSSVATGLVPVDRDGALHALAAAPLFLCQPPALCVAAARVRSRHPGLARALWVTGALTAAAAVAFVLGDVAAGAFERVALWPVIVALAAVALTVAAPPGDGAAGPR